MIRREFLASAAAGALLALQGGPALASEAHGSLLEKARELAARPYVPNTTPLPPPFAGLDYDAFRGIRPVPGKAAMLPLGQDYAVDLLPPGLFFPDPVTVEMVGADGEIRTVPFSPGLFSFEPRYFDEIPETSPGAGFTGLRLRHPLNTPDHMDEFMVVQGASYFRAIGRAMGYGLSSRAVALGTGGSGPEEFPRFTHLRIHAPGEEGVRLEAVLEGPSLAGYLDMHVRPGTETAMALDVTLLPRVEIDDVGVAPLTSMFLKGPLRNATSDDFRPRVHDSDVLFIENGSGERLWRPITNPAGIEISAFSDTSPRAYGLFQTPRSFEAFQDAEANYHIRPSAVVRPRGDWGPGAVVLVELPTGDEFMDNIVAFWRPEAPLAAGSEQSFAYDVIWTTEAPPQAARARILESRSGREHDRPGTLRYVIDFSGSPEGIEPEIAVSGSEAEVSGASLTQLPEGLGTRLTFLFTPGEAESAEIRVMLRDQDGAPISPVWLHRWTPARDGGV